jgi:hypothetical protein
MAASSRQAWPSTPPRQAAAVPTHHSVYARHRQALAADALPPLNKWECLLVRFLARGGGYQPQASAAPLWLLLGTTEGSGGPSTLPSGVWVCRSWRVPGPSAVAYDQRLLHSQVCDQALHGQLLKHMSSVEACTACKHRVSLALAAGVQCCVALVAWLVSHARMLAAQPLIHGMPCCWFQLEAAVVW